jgi:hypothetical protein
MSFATVFGPFSSNAQDASHALLQLLLEAAGPVTSMKVACVSKHLRDVELQWRESFFRIAIEAAFVRGEASGFYEALHCRSQIACMLLDSCLHSYFNDHPLPLEQYVHEANLDDERGLLCGLALDRVYAIDTAVELTLDRNDPRYQCPGHLNDEVIRRAFRLPLGTSNNDFIIQRWIAYSEGLQQGIYGKGEFTFWDWDGRLASNDDGPIPVFDARRCFVWSAEEKKYIVVGGDAFIQWLSTKLSDRPDAARILISHLGHKFAEWMKLGNNYSVTKRLLWDEVGHSWMHPAQKVVVLREAVAASNLPLVPSSAQVDNAVANLLRQHTRFLV